MISQIGSNGNLLDDTKPRPFEGNNVTEDGDVILDINNDGWVERVTAMNYGSSDLKGSLRACNVTRIGIPTEEIFEVAFSVNNNDHGGHDWIHRCIDTNGDGLLEIEFGKDKIPFTPEVTFYWNDKINTFQSPLGDSGDHFQVIKNWQQIEWLIEAGSFTEKSLRSE